MTIGIGYLMQLKVSGLGLVPAPLCRLTSFTVTTPLNLSSTSKRLHWLACTVLVKGSHLSRDLAKSINLTSEGLKIWSCFCYFKDYE